VLLSPSGSPGGKCKHARAFPGIISARKVSAGEVLTYTNPRPAAEEGANAHPSEAGERRKNAHPSEVGERRKNASPSTVLEGGCATGTAADGFVQVKKRAAELVAAAEGVAWVGASTAERMHTLRVPPGFFIWKLVICH